MRGKRLSKHQASSVDDVWPGFVDAISTLLLVIVFVLMAFVLAQFYLSDALHDKDCTLSNLRTRVSSLEATLTQEKKIKEEFERKVLELSQLINHLRLAGQTQDHALAATQKSLTQEQNLKATLESQLIALASEEEKKKEKINDLLVRLEELTRENSALILENQHSKNALKGYASEFFSKLKQAIGDRPDIRVVGDRFVFQSEVLFDVGSADLGKEGQKQLMVLVKALREISKTIPNTVPWVLRVDGHTDATPVRHKFKSNWQLSTERAISVVNYLVQQGISASHLVAAGFAEFQPLESGKDPKSLGRNRRIEFKLDQR